MNKLSLERLRGSVKQAVLGFDLHPAIVAGFALHWAWVWITFWSSKFYSASPLPAGDQILSLEPLWLLSLLTNVLCYGALFFVGLRVGVFSRAAVLPWGAAALTVVGTLFIATPAPASVGQLGAFGYVFGALLTGVGSALEVMLWAELLANRGARQVVVYSVMATVAGSLVFCLLMLLPGLVARCVTAALPAVEMWLFCRCRRLVTEARSVDSEPEGAASPALRRSLVEIGLVALFFGFSYGMMKGFFVISSDELIAVRDGLNIVALILGAVAVLLTTSVFRMDFRHMTYQVALPLMAAGFVFFSLGYPLDLVGFAAHQMGYQYFYIIIWALWAVLSLGQRRPVAPFAAVSMAAIMGGQLVGSVVGAQLVTAATSPYHIAVVAACSVFVILLVALFAFESPFPGSDRTVFQVPADEEGESEGGSLASLARSRGLSPREVEVFEYLARGRNCSFISTQLVISEETAKTHIKRIYRKFGVHSQQALLDLVELDGIPRSEG